jgi:segregation and condensation protein B
MRRSLVNLAGLLRSPASACAAPWLRVMASTRTNPPGPASDVAEADAEAAQDSQSAKLARLEGVLLLAREPLSTRKLAELAELADGTEARSLVRELGRRLRKRGSAMQAVEVAQGVQLLTRPHLAHWLARLEAAAEEPRLSGPALETLSVAAYRQPVTRAEIEGIRGVQCGEILRLLMERDLLRIVGRSEELGRPFLYGTTRKFLQVFGLSRLEHLPPVDQIRNATPAAA